MPPNRTGGGIWPALSCLQTALVLTCSSRANSAAMRCAHFGIDDQAKAVANIPSAKLNPKPPADDDGMITSALHGRCNNCSAESLSESRVGSDATRTERENPCGCKGLVADRSRLSSDGTMAGAGIEPARRFPSTGF